MTNYSIQRLSNCSDHEREIRIGDGQRATLGSSPHADLRLHLSFGLPEACLEVWHDMDRLLAENVCRDPKLVRLNGHPIYSVAQLENGDLLEIGQDVFAVVVLYDNPAAPPRPPAAVLPAMVPAPRGVRTTLKPVRLNDAIFQHEPSDAEWRDVDVLPQLMDQHDAFLFANFKHARIPVPDRVNVGVDLFENAPKEIREIYSLHTISKGTRDYTLAVYEKLRHLDAVVCAIPEADTKSSLKDVKLYLAWFTRPSVLEMTLQKSPETFSAALLKPFKMIMLRSSNTNNWVMYSKAGFNPTELKLKS